MGHDADGLGDDLSDRRKGEWMSLNEGLEQDEGVWETDFKGIGHLDGETAHDKGDVSSVVHVDPHLDESAFDLWVVATDGGDVVRIVNDDSAQQC